MTRNSSMMRKVMVLMMAFAIMFTYSVVPMNQSFAASAKKPAKVTGVKAKAASSSSIKITWKKAKNAKKYQVYRATKKSGKYKKVATTSKKSYVNKKLKASTKYFYKVRAVNGKKTGKFSKVVSAKTKKSEGPVSEKDPVLSDLNARKMTVNIDMTDSKYDNNVVRVWVPVPQTNAEQAVWGVAFDAPAASVKEIKTESVNGNQMLYLEWAAGTAAADRVATLSYNVTRYKVSRTDLAEDPSAGIPEDVKPYITKESKYVVVNDPIVKKYAGIATQGRTGYLDKARGIYEWCINNLERIDNGELLEAKDGSWVPFDIVGCGYGNTVQILNDLEKYGRAGGHCTDINSTFVALCRAAGIPAREMFGIRMSDNATGGQHCWAQFYLPGTGWTYADPGDVCKFGVKNNKTTPAGEKGMTMAELAAARASKRTADYTATYWGSVDNNRVELSRGRDVILNPAQKALNGEGYNTFGYPSGEFGTDAAGYTRIECTDAKNFKYSISCTDGPATITYADIEKIGVYKDSKESGYKLLDLRHMDRVETTKPAYDVKHIPGAVKADVQGWVDGKDTAGAKANVQAAINGDPADMKYVLICYTGNTYAKAGRDILLDLGVKNSNILILAQDDRTQGPSGGMVAWKGAFVNPEAKTVTLNAVMNDTIHMGDHLADVTHHVVVNKEGSNAAVSALVTDAQPGQVYQALKEIGIAPGDKYEGKCPAGSFVEGGNVKVNFAWNGGTAGMSDMFKLVTSEDGGKVSTADYNARMIFGGNKANLDLFPGDYDQTGCITCTFSCWIGTVSNGAYGYSTSEAYVDRTKAPAAGTEVTVTYSADSNIVTAADTARMMFDKDVKVLDVRRAASYAEGHIPGAVSADVDGAAQQTDPAAAKANVQKAIAGDAAGTKYILACYTGNKYANAAKDILKQLNVADTNIMIIGQNDYTQGADGGMAGWNKEFPNSLITPAEEADVKKNTVYVSPQWAAAAMAGGIAGYEDVVVGEVSYGGDEAGYLGGHLPGAIMLAVTEVEDADGKEGAYNLLSADTVRDNLLKHGITKDTKVILYDNGGDPCEVGRQAYAYIWCGVEDVKIVQGNEALWKYGFETKANERKAATSFGASVPAHPEYWTSMDTAKAKLAAKDPKFKLVSIRSEPEWLGKTSGYGYIDYAGEPEGAVWGRGAKTAFDVAEFLNQDGTVMDYASMSKYWSDNNVKFKADGSEHLAFYCGTGWRATVPFLVLYEAGITNVSVYDGGWYEWLYDDSNLVQVGDPDSPDCVHTTVGQLPSGKAAK